MFSAHTCAHIYAYTLPHVPGLLIYTCMCHRKDLSTHIRQDKCRFHPALLEKAVIRGMLGRELRTMPDPPNKSSRHVLEDHVVPRKPKIYKNKKIFGPSKVKFVMPGNQSKEARLAEEADKRDV